MPDKVYPGVDRDLIRDGLTKLRDRDVEVYSIVSIKPGSDYAWLSAINAVASDLGFGAHVRKRRSFDGWDVYRASDFAEAAIEQNAEPPLTLAEIDVTLAAMHDDLAMADDFGDHGDTLFSALVELRRIRTNSV